jgi:hypothetical protein
MSKYKQDFEISTSGTCEAMHIRARVRYAYTNSVTYWYGINRVTVRILLFCVWICFWYYGYKYNALGKVWFLPSACTYVV